jgi:hypothetical protein
MWAEADAAISNIGEPPSEFMHITETVFLSAYTVEFLLKMVRFRWEYFVGPDWKYNWLDSFLLVQSYIFEFSGSSGNFVFLRTIRILKLAKALRVFRLVATFKSLRAILVSLMNTLGTLGWSILMLAIIHFLFALVIVLRVSEWLTRQQEDGIPVDPLYYEEVMWWFGSVFAAMRALYGTSSGGEGWPTFYDLLEPTGTLNQAFVLFFVFFSQIAILNIILGIFVDDAMRCMESSKEEAIFEHAEQQREIAANIEALCLEADTSGCGKLSRDEWANAIRKGSMQSYLDIVGLRVCNVLEFFEIMAAQSPHGEVDIRHFVKGCMRARGDASRFDMQVVRNEVDAMRSKLR